MGYLSVTVITSFTFLLAYSFLISGAHAKLITSSEQSSQTTNELVQKRPVWQLKAYPIRRLKPLGLYRKDFQNDVEFDDVINDMDKRFDDYGHMRFGKRGVGEDGFDDYGHMRFGR